MNPLLTMAIRDAYFLRYGTAAANALTTTQIETAFERAGDKPKLSDVVEKLHEITAKGSVSA